MLTDGFLNEAEFDYLDMRVGTSKFPKIRYMFHFIDIFLIFLYLVVFRSLPIMADLNRIRGFSAALHFFFKGT